MDIFYPKSLLKKLAAQGVDVTNFRPAVTPGGFAAQKARAAVSNHAKAGFQIIEIVVKSQSEGGNLKTKLSGMLKDLIPKLAKK